MRGLVTETRAAVLRVARRGSPAWRIARAAFQPVSWTIGGLYARFGRRLPEPPVIIGGASRSGTTLLLSMLSAHPRVHAIDHETYAFCPQRADPEGADPGCFRLHRLYTPLALADVPHEARRWCEKTPRNVLFFPAILRHFGDEVRVLHVVRDGRDVVTSRHPRRPDSYYYAPDGWARAVRAGLALDEDPRVCRLYYESLIEDFEATIAGVLEFIGEPFAERVRDWHRFATVRRHSAWFATVLPAHRKSIGRWRSPEHRRRIEEFRSTPGAVELIRKLGYPVD